MTGPMFGIFHNLLPHCNHWTNWHREYMTLCPHSWLEKHVILDTIVSILFSAQTWEVAISEMGWLDPVLDLKFISHFLFFTATIAGQMKLLEHQKVDKMILQQYEPSICPRKYSYHS